MTGLGSYFCAWVLLLCVSVTSVRGCEIKRDRLRLLLCVGVG